MLIYIGGKKKEITYTIRVRQLLIARWSSTLILDSVTFYLMSCLQSTEIVSCGESNHLPPVLLCSISTFHNSYDI